MIAGVMPATAYEDGTVFGLSIPVLPGQGAATVEGHQLPPPIYCERESLHSAPFVNTFPPAAEVC